jgi:uncharacterized repeat protein (TIGR03803 family)
MKKLFLLLASCMGLAVTSGTQAQNVVSTVASFPQGVSNVTSGLVRLSDGQLYGVSPTGGRAGSGCIFRMDPSTGAVTILVQSPLVSGVELSSRVKVGLVGVGGTLYGVVNNYGSDAEACVWKWNAGLGLTRIIRFQDNLSYGEEPVPQLAINSSNTIYGVCRSGGNLGGGTLWSLDSGGTFTVVANFDSSDPSVNGMSPHSVTVASDGTVYGTSLSNAINESGSTGRLWKWTSGGGLAALGDMPATLGVITSSLVATAAGRVCGVAVDEKNYSLNEQLWTWTQAGGFVSRRSFGNGGGDWEVSTFISLHSTGDIYGTTNSTGTNSAGQLWKLDSSNVFSFVTTLPASFGRYTSGSIAQDANALYFSSSSGGATATDSGGAVWKYDLTTGAALVADLEEPTAGVNPSALLRASDGAVYGVSRSSGYSSDETLWKHTPAGGLVSAAKFNSYAVTGASPVGPLHSDAAGNIYGLNEYGGPLQNGAIWKYAPSTGALTRFATLGAATAPGRPTGAFAKDDAGNFYGMSAAMVLSGGVYLPSVSLWRAAPTGVLTKLATLSNGLHGNTVANIVVQGSTVYGVSRSGGIYGAGALWKWSATGGLQYLAAFGAADNATATIAYPMLGLVARNDGALFGLAINPSASDQQILWRFQEGQPLATHTSFTETAVGQMQGERGSGLFINAAGMLFGTSVRGSVATQGTFWQVDTTQYLPSPSVLRIFDITVSRKPDFPALVPAPDGGIFGTAQDELFRYGPTLPVGAAAPTVSTLTSSTVTATRLTFSGTVNANQLSTQVSFQYGTSATALTRSTISVPANVSGSAATAVNGFLTDLTPNTLYYIRAVAENSYGITHGPVVSLRTSVATNPPLAVTIAATSITNTNATLNGTLNAKGLSSSLLFDLGTSATALNRTFNIGNSSGTTAVPLTAPISALMPHTKYYYRARAVGDHGSSAGAVLSFTTANSAPVTSPNAAVALPSAPISIPVLTGDGDPDGDTISLFSFTQPPATKGVVTKLGNTLVFTPAASFSGTADFTYIAADAFGGKSSPTAVQVTLGSCTLSRTDLNVNSMGGAFNVDVTASAPFAVVETLPWVTLGSIDLAASPPRVVLNIAPNTSLIARSGNVVIGGVTLPLSQQGVAAPSISAASLLTTTAVGDYYSSSVSVTGSPAVIAKVTGTLPPGLTLTPAGLLSGRPTTAGSYTFSVRGTNAAGATTPENVTITVAGIPAYVAGAYHGTFYHDLVVTDGIGAYFRINVAPNGAVTGSLNIHGTASPFTAAIVDGNGDGSVPSATVIIPRAGKPTLAAYFTFLSSAGTDFVSAQLHLASESRLTLGTAIVTGTGGKAGSLTGTNIAGRYVANIDPDTTSTEYPNVPQSPGYMTIVLAENGSATVGGKLSDGTPLTGGFQVVTTPFAPASSKPMPVLIPLYGGKGVLSGRLSFYNDIAISKVAGNDASTPAAMRWMRKPQPSAAARAYAPGFGNDLFYLYEVKLAGEEWFAPPVGTNALYIAATPFNARLSVTGAGVGDTEAAYFVDQRNFTVAANSTCSFGLAASNPSLISVTLFPTLGTWTAGFNVRRTNYDTGATYITRVLAEGVLRLPAAGGISHREARGFFLLPKLKADEQHLVPAPNPATNTTVLSGTMLMGPSVP